MQPGDPAPTTPMPVGLVSPSDVPFLVVPDEWRLSIDFTGHPASGKRFSRGMAARKVLRGRFRDDIVISAEKTPIFVYTRRADVAGEAELAARQVLAQRGLIAGVRLDRWDPSDQVWRDAWSDQPEQNGGPLAADAGKPGYVPMPSATSEALATMILAGLDLIGLIP